MPNIWPLNVQSGRDYKTVRMKKEMISSLASIRFILLLGAVAAAAAAEDILPGSTLFASDPNSTWPSPSNTFTLSFFQDDPGNPNSFFAGIRYDARVPIWKAGGVSSSASLRFLSNGDLRLTSGGGSSPTVVWSSNTAGRGVSSARLDDSGNLVLRNATAPNIWSTFDNPTDTVVPSQNFTLNNTLKSGDFSFKLRQNGNLTLLWNNSITYYNSGLNSSADFKLKSPSLSMNPVGILSLSDPTLPSPLNVVYSSDYSDEGDILRFLKLDGDGNLRIYSYNKNGSRNPIGRWSALSDQCQVFGYCGNFGICSYNDSGPICSCPSENFAPVDPEDRRKGCRRNVDLSSCSSNASILQMDHAVFLTYDPELSQQTISAGISACKQTCLVSPACIASTALADGTGFCYQKLPNFVSGYRSLALPSTSFLKVCGTPLPNPSEDGAEEKKKKSGSELQGWVVGVAVAGSLLGLILLEAGLWLWCFRNRPGFSPLPDQLALLEYASGAPVQFSYRDLHRATGGFKEKLGDGGFGAVYRGVLRGNNRTVIAVKQLEGIEQGERQFRMEVATISSTHHLNLVRLIGFCSEGRRHRLLVYEFMRNGSLDLILFSGKQLRWGQRYVIALGTARAMTYLHEECRDCIVHCDIKPENILLDDNFNAKVSDFGLARLVNPKDDRYRTLTSIRGTRGYLAPEFLANLPITSKSDVYSYGMVLLEIVSGKRNFHVSPETNGKKFSTWAYEEYEKGNASAVLDKSLDAREIDMDQVMRAIEVSFWCIQEQVSQRPKMGKVVQMLEGVCHIDRPPAPKAPIEGTSFSIASSSISSSGSARNLERATSSLLHAE